MTKNMEERIVAAAVQYDGMTFSLPRPARHGQVLQCLEYTLDEMQLAHACQGFLTSEGRFVNRIQAKQLGYRSGQELVRDDLHPRDAFSEDFW